MRVTLQTLENGAKGLGIKLPRSASMERLEDLINQHMIKLDPNFGRFACEGCSKDTSTEINSCPFCGSVFIPVIVEAVTEVKEDVAESLLLPSLSEPIDDPWADAWEDEDDEPLKDLTVSTKKAGSNRAPQLSDMTNTKKVGDKIKESIEMTLGKSVVTVPLEKLTSKNDGVAKESKKKSTRVDTKKTEATGIQSGTKTTSKPTTLKKKVSKKRKAKPISAALQRRENRKSKAANKIKREKKEAESKKKRAQLRKSLPFSVGDINKMKRVTLVMLAGVLGINNPIKLGKDDVIRQTIINAQQEKYGR